jgi:hypothetical protein
VVNRHVVTGYGYQAMHVVDRDANLIDIDRNNQGTTSDSNMPRPDNTPSLDPFVNPQNPPVLSSDEAMNFEAMFQDEARNGGGIGDWLFWDLGPLDVN